jgi:ATP-binding protein involved in chromosome partitioning
MPIAMPLAQGRLPLRFGHCEQFALIDVDKELKQIASRRLVEAPDHQPGLLPRWLHEQGATLIIAGGMGQRAQGLFAEHSISAVRAPTEEPETLVEAYLAGTLRPRDSVCDH